MSLGQLNSFTVSGQITGIKISDIYFAKQRFRTGVHNDTILMTRKENDLRLRQVIIEEQYSDFLTAALGQMMDLVEVDSKGIESTVAINGYNIQEYRTFDATHTLVTIRTGKRFKIKKSLADFRSEYEGVMSLDNIDFTGIPTYDTQTEAQDDAGLADGAFFRLSGDGAATIPNNILQKRV